MSNSGGMKALVVRQLGNPVPGPGEKKPYVVITDHPTPQTLPANAVRIKIAASGLNFADALQVQVVQLRQRSFPLVADQAYTESSVPAVGQVSGEAKAALHSWWRNFWQSR